MNLFTNTLIYLSLTCLTIESKLRLKFHLFSKQANINKRFFSSTQNYSQTVLFILKHECGHL